MSTNRLSKNQAITLGVIAIMGVAVVVLNIQTFSKGRSPSRRVQASIQDAPALPEDLAILVRDAGNANGLNRFPEQHKNRKRPKLARDPFLSNIAPVVVTTQPQAEAAPKKSSIVCSAIMLGGKRSVALINGKSYAVGDHVNGLRVMSLNTTGVSLRKASGQMIFLAVGDQNTGSTALKMEFKKNEAAGKIAIEMTERNLP